MFEFFRRLFKPYPLRPCLQCGEMAVSALMTHNATGSFCDDYCAARFAYDNPKR